MGVRSLLVSLMAGRLGVDARHTPKGGVEGAPFRALCGQQDLDAALGDATVRSSKLRIEILRSDVPALKRGDRLRFRFEPSGPWTPAYVLSDPPSADRHGISFVAYVNPLPPPNPE